MALRVPELRPSASKLAVIAAGLLASLGCSSDSSSPTGVTHPTMIEVNPQDFLGDLQCADEEGSVKRYVATLFDVTEERAAGVEYGDERDEDDIAICGGFQLPSSLPTPCLASVGFGYVVGGRRYCAEVDAYDTDLIEPRANGTRQMLVSAAEGEEAPAVAPLATRRWHTACEGAVASASTIVRSGGCEALAPQPQASERSGVRVKTASLLGGLECGSEAGQVALLDIALRAEGTDIASTPQISCGEEHLFTNLPGGTSFKLTIVAFNGIGDTIAGTTCRAVTVAGTTVTAECSPLSEQGTLRVDLETALGAVGFDCDDSVTDVQVTVPGQTNGRSFPPPDCLEPFDFDVLPGPELEQVIVTVFHEGARAGAAVCFGEVEPTKLTIASCELLDEMQ